MRFGCKMGGADKKGFTCRADKGGFGGGWNGWYKIFVRKLKWFVFLIPSSCASSFAQCLKSMTSSFVIYFPI